MNRLSLATFFVGTFLCLTVAPVWSYSYYLSRDNRPVVKFRADPARVTLRP